MSKAVLAFHLEESRFSAQELYECAHRADPLGYHAQVLHEETLRRMHVLRALESWILAMAPCSERDALAVLPDATSCTIQAGKISIVNGFLREFTCARPNIVLAFFALLRPRVLVYPSGPAFSLEDLEREYKKLEQVLVTL